MYDSYTLTLGLPSGYSSSLSLTTISCAERGQEQAPLLLVFMRIQ